MENCLVATYTICVVLSLARQLGRPVYGYAMALKDSDDFFGGETADLLREELQEMVVSSCNL